MTAPAPQLLGGTDKAAIMVMLLAEEDASRILSQLTPDELRQLAGTMCGIGEIEPQAIADAIAGSSRSTENSGISGHGRVDNVRKLLTEAVGEVKTDNLMRQVAPAAEEENLPALGLLRWLDPKIIGEILADEHPQAIAVLLLQLDSEVAAQALAALPEDMHTPVLHRVARLGPVSRQAIGILEAKDLENEMFKFEHLFVLDLKMTGVLLREIESDTLVLALKGLEEDQREQFFGAMSSRAADGLRDEIEMRGRVKKSEVETAQKEVVAIAKRLIAQGDIIMGEGDEDYV